MVLGRYGPRWGKGNILLAEVRRGEVRKSESPKVRKSESEPISVVICSKHRTLSIMTLNVIYTSRLKLV